MAGKAAKHHRALRNSNEILPGFAVVIARTDSDRYVAYSMSEPWFCLERNTEREVGEAVGETVRSYLATFRQIENVEVELETQPWASDIPVERLNPISRIRPVLSGGDPAEPREMAVA